MNIQIDDFEWANLPPYDPPSAALLAQVDQAIWVYDFARHRILWANAAALQVWKAQSLAELAARDLTPNSAGTRQRLDNLHSTLAHGGSCTERWTLYPKGEPHHLTCRFTGLRLGDGALGMMAQALPQAEGSLANSYELRAIEAVRQTPLKISMATTTGHWLMHNPAAEALLRALELHNIPGMDNFLALFADPQKAAALRAQALAQGSATQTLRLTGKDFRMHEVTVRRLTDPVSGHMSLMLSQMDVTHAFRLERQLQKALKREKQVVETQRQFLMLTSHEFRTPLAIIDNAARRIGRLALGQDQITERIDSIRRAVRRMTKAVDNSLSSARIASGKFAFAPVRCDLRPILEQALASQRAVHPERSFVVDLPHLSQLMLDPALTEQIFENLLSNAIKYSPDGGPITARARLRSNAVVVAIGDCGIGIPSADMPKLFSRFFRSHNARGIKGTGVGLHAVRFFMELHGGQVDVASTEGQGTTVTLTFPLPQTQGE